MIAGIEFSRKAATGCHITSYRQLRVKNLIKVPTWRLEVESNLRPSAPKALNQPRPTTNHSPQFQDDLLLDINQLSHIVNMSKLDKLLEELLRVIASKKTNSKFSMLLLTCRASAMFLFCLIRDLLLSIIIVMLHT